MDNPYQEAQIRGRVVEQRPDPNFATIDRIAKKYTGKPFPLRGKPQERVVLMIAVERARYTALPFVHAPSVVNLIPAGISAPCRPVGRLSPHNFER